MGDKIKQKKLKRKLQKIKVDEIKLAIDNIDQSPLEYHELTQTQRTELWKYAIDKGRIVRFGKRCSKNGRVLIIENDRESSERYNISEVGINILEEFHSKTNEIPMNENESMHCYTSKKIINICGGYGPMTTPPPRTLNTGNNLPVSQFRGEILKTIHENQVCIISGATGKR